MILTDRELLVLRFLPSHLTNAEIARECFLSVNTVKAHPNTGVRFVGGAEGPSHRPFGACEGALGPLESPTSASPEAYPAWVWPGSPGPLLGLEHAAS